MEKKNSKKFSDHLEKQFSDLGFDLSKMWESALKIKDAAIMHDQVNCREMSIDGEMVLFMFNVSNAWDAKNAAINFINVRVAKNSPDFYDYQVSYERDYHSEKGPLPTKSQMLEEIKLTFENFNLKPEFIKLGFEFSELESHAGALKHNNNSVLYYERSMQDVSPNAESLVINFEVENYMCSQPPRIQKLTAMVYKTGDKVSPIVKKEYSLEKGSLPQKDKIIHEMTELTRIHLVKEKFNLDNDNRYNENLNPASTLHKNKL